MSHLTTLPPDMLRSVLIQLDPADLCALRGTCKYFCKFADDEIIWRTKFQGKFGGWSEIGIGWMTITLIREVVKKKVEEESDCELSYKEAFVKLETFERNIRMG